MSRVKHIQGKAREPSCHSKCLLASKAVTTTNPYYLPNELSVRTTINSVASVAVLSTSRVPDMKLCPSQLHNPLHIQE